LVFTRAELAVEYFNVLKKKTGRKAPCGSAGNGALLDLF